MVEAIKFNFNQLINSPLLRDFLRVLKLRLICLTKIFGLGTRKRTIHDYLTIGKLPFEDAIVPLEAQHQTGGIVDPKHNVKYPLTECTKRNLISNALKEDLEDASKTSEDNDDDDILVKIKQYQSTLTTLLNDTQKIQNHSIQFKLSCDDFHQLDVGKDFNLCEIAKVYGLGTKFELFALLVNYTVFFGMYTVLCQKYTFILSLELWRMYTGTFSQDRMLLCTTWKGTLK